MQRKPTKPAAGSDLPTDETDEGLVYLVDTLEEIDENKPAAKLNEISMIDSKGRRIFY